MVTWDGAFETSPADVDEWKYGASKIRELKAAISEREELEHDFKVGAYPFHKAGKCSVLYVGTTTEINALTGMPAGSIAWDTTLSVLKKYSGTAWEVCQYDHGGLAGLADDDHTQYLKLDKTGQTLSQNLAVSAGVTVDGVDISAFTGSKGAANGIAPLDAATKVPAVNLGGAGADANKFLRGDQSWQQPPPPPPTPQGVYSESLAQVSSNSTVYTKGKEAKIKFTGTYRVQFGLYVNYDSSTVYGKVYKNGIAFGTERSTSSGTKVFFSEDLAFSFDDLIQLYIYHLGGGFSFATDMQWWTPIDFAGGCG